MNELDYSGRHRLTPTGEPHAIKHLNEVAEWVDGVYLIENEDDGEGGEFGLANIQAQALSNRTQFLLTHIQKLTYQLNAVLSYLNSYTPDGATKIRSVISPTPPDPSKLWLKFNDTDSVENDPSVNVTLSNGETFDLFDGKTIVTVNGIKYALITENASIGGDDLPAPTVPADDIDDTLPADDDATIWADQNDIDTLLADIWRDS